MNKKYGISYLAKKNIPVKGADISPMDFFAFTFIKQAIGKSRAKTMDRVWKKCCEVWKNVSLDICQNLIKAWKERALEVSKRGGQHIEHTKRIHLRKPTEFLKK